MPRSPIDIVRRRVNFDFGAVVPGPWYPGSPKNETFLNAISFFFPPGEKFFIDSVQYYQDRISDPVLKEQVRRFVYQEAMHTRQHNRGNLPLVTKNPEWARIGRVGENLLNLARWITPRSYQLALTCALEHYTAMLCDSLLRRQDFILEHAQPAYAQLWLWHAVEETEHKAVCFDVYREVVGTGPVAYLMRAVAMVVVSFFFTVAVTIGVSIVERGPRRRRETSAAPEGGPVGDGQDLPGRRPRYGLSNPLIPWRQVLDYFRPSFHPWDFDNSHLVEEWKRRFPELGSYPGAHASAAS